MNNGFSIRIKYKDGADRLAKTEKGDWVDCYVYSDLSLSKGDYAQVDLGFSCELPEGYEAHIAPRSSTFKRYGVIQTNSVGVVDSSYCGNDDVWQMPVYATRDVEIPKGTRLCQFRIVPVQPAVAFEEVDDLGNENRDGFGSTGR